MRLKLTLSQTKPVERLPINTGYLIASAIYATIAESSKAYAEWLHHEGYAIEDKPQNFKFFTFSNLDVPIREIHGNQLISKSRQCSFLISSPKDDFLQNLVTGLFHDGHLRLGPAMFQKKLIETLPEPEFKPQMSFVMLSPTTLSIQEIDAKGKHFKHFLRPNDPRIPELMKQNLIHKYESLYEKPYPNKHAGFKFEFKSSYIQHQLKKGKGVEKLITIAEGTPKETKVKAMLCPFTIEADPELIQVGYDCGFGNNNSMGFGMVKEMIDDK
jgi:CRISPR-associated endoribonuclease Cas6